jgi:hypothetical protein
MILIANKCDLLEKYPKSIKEDFMTQEYLEEFAREKEFIGSFQASAKENINVDEAFFFLFQEILKLEMPAKPTRKSHRISRNVYKKNKKHCCK